LFIINLLEFTLIDALSDTHQYQASDVSGIKDGPLMCESKNLARLVSSRKINQDVKAYDTDFVCVESKRSKSNKTPKLY
jgi:hypothetical protein